jgi:glycosyltransferase involved in cell wall biosynthesis
MGKKVLIVSYTFPPSPNVGGRRWSKLAAHLVGSGNLVHVITAIPDENGQYGVNVSEGITIHRINSGYPAILTNHKIKSFFDKVKYALSVRYLNYTNKGNVYDKSVCWKEALQAKIIEITTKESIINVIVSAPPFQHMYYVAELKDKYPHLNIILDFRDPWAEHSDFAAFYSLSPERMQYQLQIEKLALEKADKVISISEGITEGLKKTLGRSEDKFVTITNGIDSSDYRFLKDSNTSSSNAFRIVYYGSLYPRTEDNIEALVGFINKNKVELLEANVRFEFCGHVNDSGLSILKKAPSGFVVYHGVKPYKEALQILNEASVGLIIIAKDHEDIQFNTKLMECMALHKKIFLIGPEGNVGSFLQKNNVGTRFSNETIGDMLGWILDKNKFDTLSYKNFDLSPFEFVNLAKQVEQLLK